MSIQALLTYNFLTYSESSHYYATGTIINNKTSRLFNRPLTSLIFLQHWECLIPDINLSIPVAPKYFGQPFKRCNRSLLEFDNTTDSQHYAKVSTNNTSKQHHFPVTRALEKYHGNWLVLS
ncbi:unnamed protein product [Ixodes persulcatus]